MMFGQVFSTVANFCSIFAAFFAWRAWVALAWKKKKMREKLEHHLLNEHAKGADRGGRSLVHLMDELNLSEEQILEAAFTSSSVETFRSTRVDEGTSKVLFLKHKGS